MGLPTTQRWTFLVALADETARKRLRGALSWPPSYVIAATQGDYAEGVARVEVTIRGRDRWDVQRKAKGLVADMTDRPGNVTVLDIATIKRQATRPRGGARGRKPPPGEVPAGPPRASRSCSRCSSRPISQDRWGQEYGGAGY